MRFQTADSFFEKRPPGEIKVQPQHLEIVSMTPPPLVFGDVVRRRLHVRMAVFLAQ